MDEVYFTGDEARDLTVALLDAIQALESGDEEHAWLVAPILRDWAVTLMTRRVAGGGNKAN